MSTRSLDERIARLHVRDALTNNHRVVDARAATAQEETLIQAAVRVACETESPPQKCGYPECDCKLFPAAIKAAIQRAAQ